MGTPTGPAAKTTERRRQVERGAPPSGPEREHASVRGQQQMVRRTVFIYAWAGLLLVVVNLTVAPFSSPLFTRVDFNSVAPLLAVSATVGVGLHVAVFNLTHDRADIPADSDVLARLDVFATGGIIVALTSASAGWLMLWPDVEVGRVDGVNVLGALLSVVVVLVAGMAGHIVPAAAMQALAVARRDYDRSWLTRAARHWKVATPIGARGIVGLVAWCALPAFAVAVLVARTAGGFDAGEFGAALTWSLLSLVPPVLLIVAVDRLLHRRYFICGLVLLAASVAVALQVAAIVRDAAAETTWFALTGYALYVWFVLSRSLMREAAATRRSASRVRIPRVSRAVLSWSLTRRLTKLTAAPSSRSVPQMKALVAWFMRATGRA